MKKEDLEKQVEEIEEMIEFFLSLKILKSLILGDFRFFLCLVCV